MKKIPGCTLTTLVSFLNDWKVSILIQFVAKRAGWRHQSPSASLFNARLTFTTPFCPNHRRNLRLKYCLCTLPQTGKVKQEPTMYREGPPYQRRGSLQLWQFLVTLLDDPANAHFIAWTGRGMEFKLIEPEEVSTGAGLRWFVVYWC